MFVWITRDKTDQGWVAWWRQLESPKMNASGYYENEDHSTKGIFVSDADEFKDFFGFDTNKGSCKQYNLTLKET